MLSLFISQIESAIEANTETTIPDYINEADGLPYCGNCHTPKKIYIEYNSEQILVPCACKCYQEKFDRRKQNEQEQKRQLIASQNRHSAALPSKLSSVRFDNFSIKPENQSAADMCRRYADKFATMLKDNRSLMLWGGCGNGKSTMAACIAHKLIDNGFSVAWCSFSTIIDDNEAIDAICNRAMTVDLLILDDFGAERDTRYANERIFRLIDTRYTAEKPTLYTSNLTPEGLSQRLSGDNRRIFDRMKERLFPIEFKGSSYREEISRRNYSEMKSLLSSDD